MNTIKHIFIATLLGLCLFVEANENTSSSIEDFSSLVGEEKVEEVQRTAHDWECKYIIHDCYHETVEYHYVDSYIRNVDGSISFIGNDGCVWRIPSPYYWIFKNPNFN